ncbi:MAG: IS256 family transposase [Flavobacterium sp.]
MENKKLNIDENFFKQFKSADDLDNFLHEVFKTGVEKMLEAELDEHLGYDKHSVEGINSGNSRNGKTTKLVKTKRGEVVIEVPRDRNSSFEPVILPKRMRMIDKIEDIIISLYAKGMSTRDIETQIKEIYGVSISSSSISNITERVMIDIEQWQKRPLDSQFLIVWMDGIVFKVRHENKIVNKAVYIVMGLNSTGRKEVLGLWISENESASFWMHILTEIRARGVQDIIIACTDNLKGLTQAIKAVFPETLTQLCIVHQIRNAIRFVPTKHRREFMADMKKIYQAINREDALKAIDSLNIKWSEKYPYSVKSWIQNQDELTLFLNFPIEIRKIMYTTNIIENLNRNIRKITSNKTMYPTDQAVIKSVYLSIQNSEINNVKPVNNWLVIANQFNLMYPNRVNIESKNVTLRS